MSDVAQSTTMDIAMPSPPLSGPAAFLSPTPLTPPLANSAPILPPKNKRGRPSIARAPTPAPTPVTLPETNIHVTTDALGPTLTREERREIILKHPLLQRRTVITFAIYDPNRRFYHAVHAGQLGAYLGYDSALRNENPTFNMIPTGYFTFAILFNAYSTIFKLTILDNATNLPIIAGPPPELEDFDIHPALFHPSDVPSDPQFVGKRKTEANEPSAKNSKAPRLHVPAPTKPAAEKAPPRRSTRAKGKGKAIN